MLYEFAIADVNKTIEIFLNNLTEHLLLIKSIAILESFNDSSIHP